MTANSCLGELRARTPAEHQQIVAAASKLLSSHRFIRWLKFNFVGGVGIAVQFAALFLLKSVLHLQYLAATAIAVEAAILHNFAWHERFTWRDHVQPSWRLSLPRLVRFNLSTGTISILGNLGLMRMLVGQGHMNYLLANAIAIAMCSLANFLVSDDWAFKR
jgi:putative flippase GtrA